MFKKYYFINVILILYILPVQAQLSYPIVDTAQIRCYDDQAEIEFPKPDQKYYGQDAHYEGNTPQYRDNDDGTISDLVTGLIWQKSAGAKKTLTQALKEARVSKLGGYNDWRVPNIKELYSLILFNGTDPDPKSTDSSKLTPFIDTEYFDFAYGDSQKGERIIDSQYGSSTKYVSTTMHNDATIFGVNFADGRIKGYPLKTPRSSEEKIYFFLFVRGNTAYGKNDFVDNQDGTITDRATGLTWLQRDSGILNNGPWQNGKMNWAEALAWAENLNYAGYNDWRLPNIKELHSIIDYTRSPKTSGSAAIDPLFKVSKIKDEGGNDNYPFYYSSSSHNSLYHSRSADYFAVGEALGWMKSRRSGKYELLDVHGAGSQRSDPKSGNPDDYPHGFGPQGDVRRIYNYAILVRGGAAKLISSGPKIEKTASRRNHSAPPPDKQSSQTKTSGSNRFILRLDKNNDGKIARDEFDGPIKRFGNFDKNEDGFITADEAPSGPPRRR